MIKRSVLTALLALWMGSTISVAQQLNMADQLPVDPEVRIGKLDNGMTYYLRHNENPAGMADFYILYNVGSIQEEDSETGLAHFLEHMAFNGTKNFPGNSMINWLESIGLQFGTNVNAATGMEMTYYMLSQVPLKRESIIDSTLLILHDWSHYISLDDKEIDKERGVIIEERRQRNNADYRLGRKAAPYIYNHSRYADRDMIGSEAFLRSFSGDQLRDFYHRWYRPDLQAILVVGDIAVDQVESRIKEMMADIPAPVNPQPKEQISVPGNNEPLIKVITDPEITGSTASLYIKRKAFPVAYNNRVGVYAMNLQFNAAIAMANMRLAEIAGSGAPFKSAQLHSLPLTFNDETISLQVSMGNGNVLTDFKAACEELERIRRFGFSESEFETFKISLLRSAKYVYQTGNKRENSSFAWEYIANYTKNQPILSAQHQWALTQLLVQQMKLEDVNQLLSTLLTKSNNVLIVMVPDKKGIDVPAETELGTVMADVRNTDLAPYQERIIHEPLLPNADRIVPGYVITTEDGLYGSVVWTLNNGIRVVVKPTTFSPSQIVMSAEASGGLSMVDDQDYFSASTLMPLVKRSGLGNFSVNDLKKVIGTKVAAVSPNLSRFSSGLSGSAAKSDVETMLQLTYLYFTKPRFARDEFEKMVGNNRANMENAQGSAQLDFMERMNVAIYGDKNNPRTQAPTEEALKQVNFERMQALYNALFCDAAGNYIFYFLGDIDTVQLRPMIGKYLGALPAGTQKLAWHDDRVRARKGQITKRFEVPMQTPQSTVSYNYTGEIAFNQENTMLLAMLSSCLQTRYLESIREDKGGTYGVTVNGNLARQPIETYTLSVSFKTDPAMVDDLVTVVEDEFQEIVKNGPNRSDMANILAFWKKTRPDGMKNNGAWLTLLKTYENWGEDWNTDFDEFLKKITPERVQALAQKIADDNNLVKVIMDPAK